MHGAVISWAHVPSAGGLGRQEVSKAVPIVVSPEATSADVASSELPIPTAVSASEVVATVEQQAVPSESPAASGIPTAYFSAESLSKMPEPLTKFDPQLSKAEDHGLGGAISVRIWINDEGLVDRIIVLSSELPEAFDNAALNAFRQVHFAPGEIDGKPVNTWVDIVVQYSDLSRPPNEYKGDLSTAVQ